MIVNIIDNRTNQHNILCDAVFEPSWHDNDVKNPGTIFPADHTFVYDELPRTAIAAAIRYANDKWPNVPTTIYLYDWESLTTDDDVVYPPDQLDLFDFDEEAAGC